MCTICVALLISFSPLFLGLLILILLRCCLETTPVEQPQPQVVVEVETQSPPMTQVEPQKIIENQHPIRMSTYLEDVSELIDDDCCICTEPLDVASTMKTRCNHQFHKDCIDAWKLKSIEPTPCPLCNQPLY